MQARTVPMYQPSGHFYSPITDPAQIAQDEARIFAKRDSLAGIDLRTDAQRELLARLGKHYPSLQFTPMQSADHRYYYDNPAYSYSDASVYACMLLEMRPRRIIEIGSGFTSALLLDANDLWFDGGLDLTFVEPYPEHLKDVLPEDFLRLPLLRSRAQDLNSEVFEALEAGDFLFIDSTHVAKTGSDVNHLFFNVLPSLAPGVLVHVHDVFYPFEYPRPWVMAGHNWNELYLLRAFLQYNDKFEILFFSTYLQEFFPEEFDTHLPQWRENPGGNIWLRRV